MVVDVRPNLFYIVVFSVLCLSFWEKENEEGVQKTDNSNFSWGLTGLLIAVAKETMTPLHDIYSWAISEFLYYASYIVETEQKKLKEIKKLSNRK